LLALLVAVGSSAGAQEAPAESAPVEEGVQHSWALGPTGSQDPRQPGNRQTLVYDAAPGSTIQDSVTLYNFGNAALPFRVYATDAFNKPDGTIDLVSGTEDPAGVGSWVTVLEERLSLEPGTQATIPITIVVPADARPGDHVGAILASSPVPGTGPNGVTLTVDRRTGPELVVRVQGPVDAEASIEGLSATYTPSINPLSGSAQVTYQIRNTGNARLQGSHSVTMGGIFGFGETRTTPLEFNQLLPGESIEVVVPVEGVPATVLSTATVDLETSAVDGGASTVAVNASTTTFAIPVTVIALVIVALLAIFAFRRFRRHGRSGSPSSPSGTDPSAGTVARASGPEPKVLEPHS
jgi:hypothetical protein